MSLLTVRAPESTGQTSVPPAATCAAGIRCWRLPSEHASRVLGCGEPAPPHAPSGAGRRHSGPSLAGYCLERGVHSLWIRLLIRLWGR